MDPNEPIPGRDKWINDPDQFPDELPEGVQRTKDWYAFERVLRDGRKVTQWFKRNSGGGANGQGDKVFTEQTTVVPSVAKEWEQAQKEAAKPPETRNINGVPHQVVGKDANGQDIWSPVQTANGPAQAAPGRTQRRTRTDTEGTPDPSKPGGFDNERPRAIVRDIDTNEVISDEPLTGTALDDWRESRERSRNPVGKTDKEITDAQKPATTGNGTKIGSRTEVKDGRQVTVETWRLPDGSTEERRSDEPAPASQQPKPNERGAPVRGGDGKVYYPVRRLDARTNTVVEGYVDEQGNPTGPPPKEQPQRNLQTVTKDGILYEVVPGANGSAPTLREIKEQGATTGPATRAPSLPQIVVGNSQDALRTAYDEIQAEVDAGRRTPAWGENRRKEVMDAAQLTVREAQLHEQSRQFNQTQAQSLATTKMQYGQGALRNAMQWALSINDKIDPGSPAGANLFRATFMLQMKMARDSGIYDIKPGGGQSSVGQGMPGASSQPQRRPPLIQDIDKPEKLAEHANSAAENIRAGLEADGSPRERTPAQGGPSQPMPATGTQPASGRPAIPEHLFNVDQGAPAPSTPSAAPSAPAGAVWIRDTQSNNRQQVTPEQAERGFQVGQPGSPWVYESGAPSVASPIPPAPQAMTPDPNVPRFAALEQFRRGDNPPMDPSQPMPDQVVVPPNPADPPIVGAMPPAIRHAQISSTPPWRLPPDQIDGLVQEFGPDVVFKWPGMEGAA